MNMNITYVGDLSQVKLAVQDANEVLFTDTFYSQIRILSKFNCTQHTPSEIADIIKTSSLKVEVKTYRPKWAYSKVAGFFIRKFPNTLFLNNRKLYRDTTSITNTIIHEYVHAVDFNQHGEFRFTHDCTLNNTAPYVLGQIAELIVNGSELSYIGNDLNALEHQPVDNCIIDDAGEFDLDSIIELDRID